ncbi:MAG: DUF2085 domain-containing protein [Anaerolineales bacterium]
MQTPPRKRLDLLSRIFVALALVFVLVGWLINTPPGVFGKLNAIGYAVCHQIPERSFPLGAERHSPLCARCSGMYVGAVIGLAFQSLTAWKRSAMPPWYVLVVLGFFVAAFGVDGLNSYLYLIKQASPGALASLPNLYVPNNTLRLLTGSGMGLTMAAGIFPAFNATVWADEVEQQALPGLKALALLLGITLAADLLILTESPLVLYPMAFLTIAGVLLLLTMVYTMVWVMVMRQENMFRRLGEMWLPLLAGFTIALLQIAAIDALRFWGTGTWEPFSFSVRR